MTPPPVSDLLEDAQSIAAWIVELRRQLHRHRRVTVMAARVHPGCFAFIGVSHADWHTRHSVHHPKFRVDESALPIGAALHVAMALEALAARAPAGV